MFHRLQTYLGSPVSIAPLITFRVLFGAIMFVSLIRFMLNGWVEELYVQPTYFFAYWGFEWVKPLGAVGMQVLFGLMAVAALGISAGASYRKQGIEYPAVYAGVFVTLNGRSASRYIDPTVDLSEQREGFHHKEWIFPFEDNHLASR